MSTSGCEGGKGEAANPTHCIFQSVIKNVLLMTVNTSNLFHQHNPRSQTKETNQGLDRRFSHKYLKYRVIAVLWVDH